MDAGFHRLGRATALLMALAAGGGLILPIYRDNLLVTAAWGGNDMVTLAVAAPLTWMAARGSARGSRRLRPVLLGMLLYAFYSYAFYLFGAAFNAFFLLYVAVVTTAGFGLVLGGLSMDPRRATAALPRPAVTRGISAFMVAVGTLLGGFWISLWLAFLTTGDPPAMVAATGHVTNVTGALDLSLVVSLAFLGGFLLWRRRGWGYILAVAWCVKGAVYMLALSAAAVAAWRAGAVEDLGQLGLWVPMGIGSLVSAGLLLRRR